MPDPVQIIDSTAALRQLARRFRARYLEGEQGFHLWARHDIAPARFCLIFGGGVRRIINDFYRHPSLLPGAFHALMTRAKQLVRSGEA